MQQEQQVFGLSDDMLDDGNTNIPFHKFKTGAHKFRLLPPFSATSLFWEEWLHWIDDREGKPHAITCGKRFYRQCPLCDVKQKARAMKDNAELVGDAVTKKNMETLMGKFGARPTFMWHIMVGDDYKILQLSNNGQTSLLSKVKFYWNEKRINLTDPNANYMMYVERTGEKSATKYAFEVLDTIPPAKIQLPKYIDLTTVYPPLPINEMVEVANSGFAKSYANANSQAQGAQVNPGFMQQPVSGAPVQPQTQQPAQPNMVHQPQPAAVPQAQQPVVGGSHFQTPPTVSNFPTPAPAVVPTVATPSADVPYQPQLTVAPQPIAAAQPAVVPQQAPQAAPINSQQEAEIQNMLAALNGGARA